MRTIPSWLQRTGRDGSIPIRAFEIQPSLRRGVRGVALLGKGPQSRYGQPTRYRPEYCEIAKELCAHGASVGYLAEFFGVTSMTIYRWRLAHPEFAKVVNRARSRRMSSRMRSDLDKARAQMRPLLKRGGGDAQCAGCGKELMSCSPRQKFCSADCRRNTWNETRQSMQVTIQALKELNLI